MQRIKPPSELDIDASCLKDTWKKWKESWELYSISSGLNEKDGKIQSATVQSILGPKARRVLKTLPDITENATERTVTAITAALETYCVPRKNITYERYLFRMATQGDRPFDVFLTELRRKAETCEFGVIKDSLIPDQIVIGTNNLNVRERLLHDIDLTLAKAVDICHIAEQSKEHSKILSSPASTANSEVDSVTRKPDKSYKKRQPTKDNFKPQINKCKFCDRTHEKGKCPAYGQSCRNCNGRNHYARCCKKSTREVCVVESQPDQEAESLFIGEVKGTICLICLDPPDLKLLGEKTINRLLMKLYPAL